MPEPAGALPAVTAIKSLKAFQQWLSKESGKSTQWFAGRDQSRSKCLLISTAPEYDCQFDSYTISRLQLYPLQLPTPREARQWWFALWEGEISTGRVCTRLYLLVVAKIAVWNALPDFYLTRPTSDFVEIEISDLRQIVGDEEIGSMLWECSFLGISTRSLDMPAAKLVDQRLAAMKNSQSRSTPARSL